MHVYGITFMFIKIILQQLSSQSLSHQWSDVSQIEGPSLKNTHGFRVSQHKVQDAKALHEVSTDKRSI